MLVAKHGGRIIEVDGTIVLATDDNMTDEVDSKHASLPLLMEETTNLTANG